MSATIAAQMTSADFLKLRKKRGTLIWALVLALAPLLIFFIVRAAQHSSNPLKYAPAGGVGGYTDGIRILATVFGPLAGILVGAEAGAGDAAAGVFRDLVVTGRSRVALFASRVPATLALTWLIVVLGFAVLLIGTYAFSSGTSTPSASLVFNGLGFTLLTTGVITVVASGFASLTASRPTALTVLIGFQLVASPILSSIESLGSSRKALLSDALAHFSPVHLGGRGNTVAMSEGVALIAIVAWLVAFLALGAWRTRSMDA
jgi:ABC-type transport system involved in multi-copper enzyme maturation permease subunit